MPPAKKMDKWCKKSCGVELHGDDAQDEGDDNEDNGNQSPVEHLLANSFLVGHRLASFHKNLLKRKCIKRVKKLLKIN